MADDLPYKTEYAKSGRSGCKNCRTPISQGSLRIAVMVQSPMFDGKQPNWYHDDCFFQKHKPKAVGDIAKFDSLRYEDQKKIKERINLIFGTPSPAAAANGKGKKKAPKRGKAAAAAGSTTKLSDFQVEYAKSNRAECIGCNQKIQKDELRAAKMDYESEKALRFGGLPRWYHLDCFAQCRPDTEFWESGEKLPGYKRLEEADRDIVKATLPKMAPVKKEEVEDGPGPSKRSKVEEAAYAKQSKKLFELRDHLMTLKKSELTAMLESNKQQVPPGTDRILDLLIDTMTFGALDPCPECSGPMYYRNCAYHCGGSTEWAKCAYTTKDPPRKKFKVTKKMMEKHDFLSKYKSTVGKRLIEELERSTQSSINVPTTFKSTIKVNRPPPPLSRMEFAIQGTLSKPLKDIKTEIQRMGGKVVTKVDDKTTALISDQKSVDTGSAKKIKDAEAFGVQVLPIEFLDAVAAKGDATALSLITKLAISPWGSDPADRLAPEETEAEKAAKKSQSMYMAKSSSSGGAAGSSKIKVQLKGGAYVDPASGMEKSTHVYKQDSCLYTAVLNKSDVQTGKNSFYKLQVLESDNHKKWYVFRAWGRIGTTIGGTKLENFQDPYDACENFEDMFMEQTGNHWSQRNKFKKIPGKYYLQDLDMGESAPKVLSLENQALQSSLHPQVQDLIKMIFNVKAMEQTLLEFEIDLEKMPLGKLSQRQIKLAFAELGKLQNLVHGEAKPVPSQIVALTNAFYTLIPHSAGMELLPLLDNEAIIKSKLEMLENLMEMEVAFSMMKVEGGEAEKGEHPIDQQYSKLKTTITVLEKSSEEFGLLQTYVKNTHAETHQQYDLDVLEVFKVERHGENTRYKPFQKLGNRKLLWHGSRTTNYAGILSQGLRIAPPEAPVTGYMFGKGIYFADMVSKSANYCCTTRTNRTGLMLLCDVALGNMLECTTAKYVEKLPKGKHSVKGLGMTHPDPEMSVKMPHGVEVPLGKGKQANVNNSSLLYNEYIVYDQSQVKIEYLLKMNFNFKY